MEVLNKLNVVDNFRLEANNFLKTNQYHEALVLYEKVILLIPNINPNKGYKHIQMVRIYSF